jgi:microcystin-dependent protein
MAITLRTEKGTALTYAEMDKNFSSFFYSASVDYTNDLLQLWYTGSADLSTIGEDFSPGRVINIPLNPTDNAVTAVTVAGDAGQVQFRDYNNSILAASSNFIYSSTGNLGIGTPLPTTRLHVRGSNNTPATLQLQSNNGGNSAQKSTIEFYEGTTLRGEIGRLSHTDNDIYIKTAPGGNLTFKVQDDPNTGAWTTTGLGIGTIAPQRKLHVVGEGFITTGLGIGTYADNHAIYAFDNIGPATPQKSFKSFARFANFGGPNGGSVNGLNMITYRQEVGDNWISTGTRIQQLVDATYMGYVQFSGPDNLYGISIGTGNSKENAFGAIHEPGHPDIQERFRIDQFGNVTINKPVANAKFDVNGDTIVTGSFTTTGNATIKGNIVGQGTANISGNTTIGGNTAVTGTATIGNIPLGTAGAGTKVLTANNDGQIQYITGTFPLGGIVMWAGSPAAPPTGWTLCDGRAPVGGITIPDLRERFIVGAGGDNPAVNDSTGYNVGATGGAGFVTLTTSQMPSHTHPVRMHVDSSGQGVNAPTEINTANSDEAGTYITPWTTTDPVGGNQSHENRPPYYALAFIIYTGA